MTITYTSEVATGQKYGRFLLLLARWRGSLYQMVWSDLLWFLGAYYVLFGIYHLILPAEHKIIFEEIVEHCSEAASVIPLLFVLGFYVSIVVKRWWSQHMTLPWPDPIAVFLSSLLHGLDTRAIMMRRTIMRYVCLSLVMVLRNIAPGIKKLYPTMDHLVVAGMLEENEKTILENLDMQFPTHFKYWVPIVWATSIVTRARKEGLIRDEVSVRTIIDALNNFRNALHNLLQYDFITVPLVYTQVVTLAVYSYSIVAILAQQWTDKSASEINSTIEFYFPVWGTLEFCFIMGWLKVAESLISPFGEDDDDFETRWLVERNMQVSYMIVDEMYNNYPIFINTIKEPQTELNNHEGEEEGEEEEEEEVAAEEEKELQIYWRRSQESVQYWNYSSPDLSLFKFSMIKNQPGVFDIKSLVGDQEEEQSSSINSIETFISSSPSFFELLREERARERDNMLWQKVSSAVANIISVITTEGLETLTTNANAKYNISTQTSEISLRIFEEDEEVPPNVEDDASHFEGEDEYEVGSEELEEEENEP